MNGEKKKLGPESLKIGVRETTMRKFRRIARMQRWTLVETADALADAFLERLGQSASAMSRDGDVRRDEASTAA